MKYELLESMGSRTDPCDPADTSWADTNYYGSVGKHQLNGNGLFELVAPGEKIGGFSVKAYKKVSISWRLFAGVTEPSINYLIDQGSNQEWNCGVDRIEEECPEELEFMWDFVVQ